MGLQQLYFLALSTDNELIALLNACLAQTRGGQNAGPSKAALASTAKRGGMSAGRLPPIQPA